MIGRLKFRIEDLVDNILDRVPPEFFESSDKTFLDPAMGGGQFVTAIVDRLRDAGHNDENIRCRVFGCEANKMRTNYAVTKNGLKGLGTFETLDVLAEDQAEVFEGRKFDVVVGNPPFQPASPGDRGLWAKFIKAGSDALVPGGVLAMIVPHGWKSPTSDIRKGGGKDGVSVFKDIFIKQNLQYINIDPSLGNVFFPGIGQTFTWFVMEKGEYSGLTKIDLGDNDTYKINISGMKMLPSRISKESLSIVKKMTKFDNTWDFKRIIMGSKEWKAASPKKTNIFPYARINGNSNRLDQTVYTKKVCPLQGKKKVFIPREGSKYRLVVDGGQMGVTDGYYILLDARQLVGSARTYFESKLVRWIGLNKYTQYNEGALMNCVGAMPLEGGMTEEDIFDFYRISRKEVSYVDDMLNGT